MNFELSDEQTDIQKAAMEFAKGEFDPDVAIELDRTKQFPEAIWKKASKLGFIGIHYPEEFGGQGLGFFENVLIIEAFCRVESGIGNALATVDLGSEVILKFGTNEQKKNVLLPLARGEKRLSTAFSESEDGRDFSFMSTIAEEKDKEYLVNGGKRFVLNADISNQFLILCKEPGDKWTMLIVERERDGLEVVPIEKMGLRMVSFGDLYLNEVRVPRESRVGCEGRGLIQANDYNQVVAVRNAAQALGMTQGAFDRVMKYAREREQFGKKLSQFQVIKHKLAEMIVGIEVGRFLTYKYATEYDQGKMDTKFLSITKLEVGRRLVWVVDEALQVFGGYGYIAEQAIEHYFRDAWAVAVELGTEEELKDVIADRIFGFTSGK